MKVFPLERNSLIRNLCEEENIYFVTDRSYIILKKMDKFYLRKFVFYL